VLCGLMMKPDTKCTTKTQILAQEQLHRMLAAPAHLDNIDAWAVLTLLPPIISSRLPSGYQSAALKF